MISDLERLRDVRRRELDVLEARLEDATRSLADVEATLDASPRRRLPLRPVAAVLAAVLAANAAVFFASLIVEAGCRDQLANAFYGFTLLTALLAMPFTKGPGGGGYVRPWLRRLAIVFIAISLLQVLYAVFNLEGVGFSVP